MNLILDFLLLLGALVGLLWGLRRGFLRTILGTLALLLAMAFAALVATPLVAIFVRESGSSQSDTPIGIAFTGLLFAIYAILEGMFRSSFPETRIRALGALDNVLGFVVGIGWTLLALALLTLIVSYATFAIMGAPNLGLLGGWASSSSLVAFLRDFFQIPVSLMRFLFPAGLPQPLAFFAGS